MSDKRAGKQPEGSGVHKVLLRLGITYGVLRRLGFQEERVLECLKNIRGVDLEEAFDWLYLHCTEDELVFDKPIEPAPPRTPRNPNATFQQPEPRNTPSDSRQQNIQPPAQPATQFSQQSSDHEQKLRILATYGTSSNESSSDEEVEDPNIEYAQLRVKLDELEIMKRKAKGVEVDAARSAKIRSRLETLKSHYFFKMRDAQALYKEEKRKADMKALKERLEGKAREKTDDEEGCIFGTLLDAMPESEVTNGVEVRIRDMSLPKTWSGRTPKALLLETVQKVDRQAVVSYRILPGVKSGRAKRAAVSVRWEGTKSGEWCMEDVSCWDEVQAEQYISTVALHDLTFGRSEGFAGGVNGLSSGSGNTYFRLLPPPFRDLWDELEVKRKENEDSANRATWAALRQIVEGKLGGEKKIPNTPTYLQYSNGDNINEDLKAFFMARQSSHAYQEMLLQRNTLPIAQYRNDIINTLEHHQVMVLSGETGCGKSTQLPSFILEHYLSEGKHCKIYCTEPRRISAISLAQRVSAELGEAPGSVGTLSSLVGYAIRLESNTTRNTRLAFVTNGIALRMLESGSGPGGQGTAFDEITHIIIDEVHERNLDSDFLLIVLKSLLEHRKDLKVVLMSATLDSQKISEFFGGCPVLNVPGRTFPVDVRFLEDAVEYTGWTIKEGSPYARRADGKYYRNKNKTDWSEDAADIDEDDADIAHQEVKLEKRYSAATKSTVDMLDDRLIPYDLIARLLERICFEDVTSIQYSGATLIFMPGLAEIRRLHDMLSEHSLFGDPSNFRIFPLHSTISSDNQAAVFEIPPPGVRKIVISTNIAETGVTIPDITCVIDTGKHREMRFDEKRQISRLIETLIAKSNATQRRGRAGRVQAGICYHLFTRSRHEYMAESPLPEMLRLSLSDLALRIKILKVKLGNSIEEVLSRALDPPLEVNVQRAVQALVEVKALTPTQDITPMGRLLSKLPTDVHLGKFLLIATIFGCLDPALTIAATLNSKSPFVTPFGHEQEADRARRSFQSENSDFLTIHNAFSSWRRTSANGPGFVRKFCKQNFLSHQNLQQIEELRQQFLGYLIDSGFMQVSKSVINELSRARYNRNKTRFVDVPAEYDRNSKDNSLINAALVAGLYPKVLTIEPSSGQMRTVANNQPVSFHPSSVNAGKRLSEFGVSYLAYFTVMQSKKLYAWETGPIDNLALMLLCGDSEFKLPSETISLDRKIKFRVGAKSCIAMKHLREQFSAILSLKMRKMPLNKTQEKWYDLGLKVLSRTLLEESSGPGQSIVISSS
ncbi:hypothetical protein M422DRAFT_75059 [Sphaerobolus stellatus SS14]|uniref:RNA helicase n=1 Tax=Sphaerobolus stellatus (strain SS14) TaxID=990650 RepID=A0A0C9VF49_SPHS4|nr:hypothetical protein M422DRAFT_75059 [Sphaerobolus stellatus SS14]